MGGYFCLGVQFYDLTLAEARIISLLAACATPQMIAEQLHIGLSTVRTHIKHIYKKLGVQRQSELLARVFADLPGGPMGHQYW